MAYQPLKPELQINTGDEDYKGEGERTHIEAQENPDTQEGSQDMDMEEEEELNEEDTIKLLQEDKETEDLSEPESKSEHDEMLGDGAPKIRIADKKRYKVIRYILGIGVFVLLFAFLTAAITLIAIAPSCKANNELEWWKTTVIYQCYPKSFKDSDDSGTGDLNGITDKLNYFVDIGVDTIWLNPIFKSPQKDTGYDISDYTDIDPIYGTMDDFLNLLKKMKSMNLRLLLDFVPNHTSDEHPWFKESRSNTSNPKRDWYIWADGKPDGGPPNNWLSLFGGPAWTFDNTTGQYYFHQFGYFQPDLNYRNPKVVKEMENVLRFWLDHGVDGFRIDAVKFLLEDPDFHDEAPNPKYTGPNCTINNSNPLCYTSLVHNLTSNYPGIHDIIKGWRKVIDGYSERFIVGEVYDPVKEVMTYYGENGDEFHFPFNFILLNNTNWTGMHVSQVVSSWLDNMPNGSWPNWVLGNHDNSRIASKVGNYLARALNVLLLTLPGTPTSYYGEEIFMTDVDIPTNKTHDITGRDKERTPMQWDSTANAGFTSVGVEPWLPVAVNYTQYNVEVEGKDNTSMLSLYKQLVYLRSNDSFKYTGYELVVNTTEIYAYRRFCKSSSDEYIVVINFAEQSMEANLNSTTVAGLQDPFIVLSSNLNRTGNVTLTEVPLSKGEAIIIKGSRPGHGDSCS